MVFSFPSSIPPSLSLSLSLSLSYIDERKREAGAEDKKKKKVKPSGSIRLNRLHPKPTTSHPRQPLSRPPIVETKGEIHRGMPVRGSHRVWGLPGNLSLSHRPPSWTAPVWDHTTTVATAAATAATITITGTLLPRGAILSCFHIVSAQCHVYTRHTWFVLFPKEHNKVCFYQYRLTLISIQFILHFFLVLKIRKSWEVSWTEIKVNLHC